MAAASDGCRGRCPPRCRGKCPLRRDLQRWGPAGSGRVWQPGREPCALAEESCVGGELWLRGARLTGGAAARSDSYTSVRVLIAPDSCGEAGKLTPRLPPPALPRLHPPSPGSGLLPRGSPAPQPRPGKLSPPAQCTACHPETHALSPVPRPSPSPGSALASPWPGAWGMGHSQGGDLS